MPKVYVHTMLRARTLPLVLLALLAGGGVAVAGDGEQDAGAGSEAPVAGVPVAIPFEHRVGDRWRIFLERREGPAEAEGLPTEVESEAEVLSLYGRDVLVEVRALAVASAGRRQPLVPRTEENASQLDERGGGRLTLRVDRQGTAVALLNGEEVRTALARAHGPLGDAAWTAAQQGLLGDWNAVYRACGVPLVPGRPVTTPLRDDAQREVGRDARVLSLEPRARGRVPALVLSASTVLDPADAAGSSWREVFAARFDLDARRLSGSSVIERREAGRTVRVRLTFRESASPAVPVVALAR